MVGEPDHHVGAEVGIDRKLRVASELQADPQLLAAAVAERGQIAVQLHHRVALQVVPCRPVEVAGGSDVHAVLRLERLDDRPAVAEEIGLVAVGHVAAVGTGRTVNAVGAQIEQLPGLRHTERPRLRPGIVHQALEVRLAVLADPLAVRMLVEELGAKTGVAVVEQVEPREHLHALFVSGSDEYRRRVDVADDFRVTFVPSRPLADVGFHVADKWPAFARASAASKPNGYDRSVR